MITVSEVIEKIIKNSYFLEEGLSSKIINLSSLSRKLKPEVEEQTLKKVSTGAILMALKRLSVKIESKTDYKNLFKKTPEMILRSNLVVFSLVNSSSLMEKLNKLFNSIYGYKHYFLTITQGVFETGIIISREGGNIVRKIFKEEKIIKIIDNLSAITIKLPEENVSTPGVYYFILKVLAWEKINIIEVVSTSCEFTIILEDEDTDRAFSVLKKALSQK